MKSFALLSPLRSALRPVKGQGAGFPIYPQLDQDLLRPLAAPARVDETARHVCSVLSSWAYSDLPTVAMMMTRLGLEARSRCRCFEIVNHGMLLHTTAYLIQSRSGKVALLAYRGTDPFDLSAWAVDNDVNPATVPVPDARSAGREQPVVHGGFYRNQRATWFGVVGALARALSGQSILSAEDAAAFDEADRADALAPGAPLEALYVTGHSLGAAQAALASYRIASDANPTYRKIAARMMQTYLFAPPMVGNAAFAQLWQTIRIPHEGSAGDPLAARVFCHTFERDIVPHLPPEGKTRFAHVGTHYQSKHSGAAKGPDDYEWVPGEAPRPGKVLDMLAAILPLFTSQVSLDQLLEIALPDLVAKLTGWLLTSKARYSFADHLPTNYVLGSQPAGKMTEFGDDF